MLIIFKKKMKFVSRPTLHFKQVEDTLRSCDAGDMDQFLDSAMVLAIGLQRLSLHRSAELTRSQIYLQKITKLATNDDFEIEDSVFQSVEAEMSQSYQPLVDRLEHFQKQNLVSSNGNLSADEVLATFTLAMVSL